MSNARALFFKIVTIITVMLFILSLHNLLALIMGIRPQTVITYSIIGVFISYASLTFYDRLIAKKEEPLPSYILEHLRLQEKEQEIIKEFLAREYDITYEEIEIRAKARDIIDAKDDEKRDS